MEAEVLVSWRGELLGHRRVRDGERVSLGDVPGAWMAIPCGALGLDGFELVRVDQGEVTVCLPARARARMERGDGTVELLPVADRSALGAREAAPPQQDAPGARSREVCLTAGEVVRLGIGPVAAGEMVWPGFGPAAGGPAGTGADGERFSVTVTAVGLEGRSGRWLRDLWRSLSRETQPSRVLGLSLVLHLAVLAGAIVWPADKPEPIRAASVSLDVHSVTAILANEPDVPPIGPPLPPEPSGQTAPADPADPADPAEPRDEAEHDPPPRPTSPEQPLRWGMGGALMLGGLAQIRWRRALRLARAHAAAWTWAGALGYVELVGRRAEKVGLFGVPPSQVEQVRAAGGRHVSEDPDKVAAGTLDAVVLGPGALAPEVLLRAWRAVRVGGAVLVDSPVGEGEAVARDLVAATSASVVWLFERDVRPVPAGRAFVLAIKGHPTRGPASALDVALGLGRKGAPIAAIASAFRCAWPFRDGDDATPSEVPEEGSGTLPAEHTERAPALHGGPPS